mgnify:FL=1|tara:strand:- start:13 stop:243 length:231 start_codon:yes stop_codon:yes gene_type:complete
MADKYVLKHEGIGDAEDKWKDAIVEKEYQPAKAKMEMTYRQLENELSMIAEMESANEKRKAEIEKEMEKIKAVADK